MIEKVNKSIHVWLNPFIIQIYVPLGIGGGSTLRWIIPQSPVKHRFEFMNGFYHIVLFTFPIIECVTRSHGVSHRSAKNTLNSVSEFMNGYVLQRLIAARYLRGANDENKQRGLIHVKSMKR